VKAITWSPNNVYFYFKVKTGLLVSGGGTADKCIRFWNIINGTQTHCIDTGSQVCNLAWSKNSNEFVSTHVN
jgi:cell division cycle 20-like protein 1 (cofactor of APC complex)